MTICLDDVRCQIGWNGHHESWVLEYIGSILICKSPCSLNLMDVAIGIIAVHIFFLHTSPPLPILRCKLKGQLLI